MKKLLTLLVAAGCLTAFQANAASLTEVAQSAQHSVDSTASSVDTAIGNALDIANQKKADMENKKAEIEKAQQKKEAEAAAKKAERQKAVEDTKNSLNNLKNAFTR